MRAALFILLLPLTVLGQMTNRISQLPATNVLAGSNLIAVVTHPLATNGTKAVRMDNLFSNVTFKGSVTNMGGQIFWTKTFQTTDATTNTVGAQFPLLPGARSKSIIAHITGNFNDAYTASFGLHSLFYVVDTDWTNTSPTTIYSAKTATAPAMNARLTTSGTNAVVLVTGIADPVDWTISLQVIPSP